MSVKIRTEYRVLDLQNPIVSIWDAVGNNLIVFTQTVSNSGHIQCLNYFIFKIYVSSVTIVIIDSYRYQYGYSIHNVIILF